LEEALCRWYNPTRVTSPRLLRFSRKKLFFPRCSASENAPRPGVGEQNSLVVNFALTRERRVIALRFLTDSPGRFFLGTAHRDGAAAPLSSFRIDVIPFPETTESTMTNETAPALSPALSEPAAVRARSHTSPLRTTSSTFNCIVH
jgi:hypothetical protein